MTLGHNIATYNAAAAVALVAMVAMVAYDNIAPKPDPKIIRAQNADKLAQMRREAAVTKARYDEKAKSVEKRIWVAKEEKASPILMDELGRIAASKGVTVNSFRPQKVQAVGGLRQLGFAMSVEGSFTSVMGLVGAIERSQSRAAVTQLQVTSSDSLTDTVKAQIGLSAFAPTPEQPAGSSARSRRVASNE